VCVEVVPAPDIAVGVDDAEHPVLDRQPLAGRPPRVGGGDARSETLQRTVVCRRPGEAVAVGDADTDAVAHTNRRIAP